MNSTSTTTAATPKPAQPRWLRLLKHRWLDESDNQRALPPDVLERLTRRVVASEQRHSGEIRICVEAGLPASYIWQNLDARDRAVMLFSKLRVWDTEQNNGVLIYLLLAEQRIELVADRGIARKVNPDEWAGMVAHLSGALKAGKYEEGLTTALEQVSAVLVREFALGEGQADSNELPDAPVLL